MTLSAFERFLSPMSFRQPHAAPGSGWSEHGPFVSWVVGASRPRLIVDVGPDLDASFETFTDAVAVLGLPTRCVGVVTLAARQGSGSDDEDPSGATADLASRYPGATVLRSRWGEVMHPFSTSSIDLLHVDAGDRRDEVWEALRQLLPRLSERGVALVDGARAPGAVTGVAQGWGDLAREYPAFVFDHGRGLGVLAVGKEAPEAIRDLTSLTPASPDAAFVRDAYRQLGRGLASLRTGLLEPEALSEATGARLPGQQRPTPSPAQEAAAAARRQEATLRQLDALETALLRRQRSLESELDAARRLTPRGLVAMVRGELRGLGTRLLRADVPDESLSRLLRGLFDVTYYRSRHPELAWPTEELFERYLRHDWPQGISPTPLIDAEWYAERNPDVTAAGFLPLAHYLVHGDREGRDPNAAFDVSWYRLHHAAEVPDDSSALLHFVQKGDALGYDPSPAFSTAWYKERYPEVLRSGRVALADYLDGGALRGRDPHPDFDTAWYVTNAAEDTPHLVNPLVDYLTHGLPEGRATNAAGARLCQT